LVACHSNDPCPFQPTAVPVSIVAHSPDKKTIENGAALGSMYRNRGRGITIAIYYEHIEFFSRTQYMTHPSMLLGMVMTHEIGHFFGLDHTVSGSWLQASTPMT
jgi:hypothetical protein